MNSLETGKRGDNMIEKYPLCKAVMDHKTRQCKCKFKEIKVMLFFSDSRCNETQTFKFRNCHHLVGCVEYMSRAGKVFKNKIEFPEMAVTYADGKMISMKE